MRRKVGVVALDDSAPEFATSFSGARMALVEGMGEALLNSNLVDGKAQNCLQNAPETIAKSSEAITNGIGHLKGETIWSAKPIQKGAAWLNGGVAGKGPRSGDAPIEMQNGGSGAAGSNGTANGQLESDESASESGERHEQSDTSVENRSQEPKHNGGMVAINVCSSNERENSAPFLTSASQDYDRIIETVIQCLDEKIDKNSLTEEALELLSLVPEGYIPLPHQIGGHRHVDGKLGFLRRIGHPQILFKPVQPGIKGPREVLFYKSLFNSRVNVAEQPPDIQCLRDLIPHYYGIEIIQDRAGHMQEFLKLEDITHKFRRPCIMDVKLGRRVWDDFAEQDKIDRERKKYPAQEIIGFRIIGMRVFNSAQGDYTYYDRFFGRSVTEDSALQAVSNFFYDGAVKRTDVLKLIVERLEHVFLKWLQNQTTFKLFATSLLFVYEGDRSQPISPNELLAIRLVDFAHAFERNPGDVGPDENILFGLRNLIEFLQRLT